MKITVYNILQDAEKHPALIREREQPYVSNVFPDPGTAAKMLNAVFAADLQCEEHMYMIAVSASNEALGVFDVTHGTMTTTFVDGKGIFTRALLCGAAGLILAHNHPSGGLDPSQEDIEACRRMRDAGRLMGVWLMDFLIIGKCGEFFSFAREGLCDLHETR